MAESGFEAALEPETRRLYNALPDEDRQLLDAVIREIERDPYPDGVTKLELAPLPHLVGVYLHPEWAVLYRLAEPGHIAIYAIAPPFFPPAPGA